MNESDRERLTMLIEEAAEVIHIATKVLRHGWDSYHPDDPGVTNRTLLEKEIKDFDAVKMEMFRRGDILPYLGESTLRQAWEKKLRYTHHQGRSPGVGLDEEGSLR
jgi:hypothetical protein